LAGKLDCNSSFLELWVPKKGIESVFLIFPERKGGGDGSSAGVLPKPASGHFEVK